MLKMTGVLVVAMAAGCAEDESDPHRLVPCDPPQTYNGMPVTTCEAACSPYPGVPTGPACALENGESTSITHQWLPTRVRGLCVIELPHTRFVECID